MVLGTRAEISVHGAEVPLHGLCNEERNELVTDFKTPRSSLTLMEGAAKLGQDISNGD